MMSSISRNVASRSQALYLYYILSFIYIYIYKFLFLLYIYKYVSSNIPIYIISVLFQIRSDF